MFFGKQQQKTEGTPRQGQAEETQRSPPSQMSDSVKAPAGDPSFSWAWEIIFFHL
jgi:hypothetical protein